MCDRNQGQITIAGHTQQLFTHLSQGQKLPAGSDVNVCGNRQRQPVKSTSKGLESNATPSCGECGAPPRCHCSQCLHSVQTVQHVCKQEIGTNLFDATVYLLIFCWSSACLLTECSVIEPHPFSRTDTPHKSSLALYISSLSISHFNPSCLW